MTIRTRALFLMGLIAAVSCSDSGNPLITGGEKPQPPPSASLVALDCTVAVSGGGMQCVLPQPGAGDASASGELIVGGQNVYVRLAASNFSTPADTIQFDVTVENLIPQALGTTDGVSAHPDGVRVFFYDGPVSNNPSAAASVANPDGTAFFTSAAQPYFQYNEMLAPNQTSSPRTWKIQYAPGSTSVSFRVYVWAQVQYENGWIDVTPPADTLEHGGSVTLAATARDKIGRTGTVSQSFTWSRGGDSVTSVNAATGEVTALSASGVDTIYVTNGTQAGRAVIVVENAPVFQQDTIAAISNVTAGRPAPRLVSRISDTESNADIVPGTYASVEGGVARVYADGSYDYLAPAGFSGADSFEFDISDGVHTIKGSVIVDVAASTYWYVQAGASGTTDGRDRFPFASMADAQAVAAAGDSIFVLSAGATALDGAVVLQDQQALIGQGIPASITRTLNDTTVMVLAAGAAPGLTRSDAGPAVTLGVGNTIRGVGLSASSGAGITGNGFGTLTTSQLGVSATGPALHLTTGTLAAEFDVLSSTNSGSQGLYLSGVGGTLTVTGGAISGATGTAVDIAGSDGTITYPGNVTNSAGLSVSVTGRSGGTVTLSGDISDTGSGILVTGNTAGTVAFTGTSKSLSTGTNTAVTLSGNTGATIAFENGGLKIATTTGTGFSATTGGTIAVFNGASNDDIAVSGAGAHALVLNGVTVSASGIAFDTVNASGTTTGSALHIDAVDGAGTVAITSAEVAGTSAPQAGIRVADNSAPVTIASATVDGTGGAGILVSFNTGAVTVSGGSIGATTAPTGAGIMIAGGTGDVTIASSVTQNSAARVADVQDRSAGTVTLTGAMSCTTSCTGLLAQNNTGGVILFNATSKVFTTGANQAVTLAGNSGSTLGFGGGGLAIITTTGTGFGASGGGTVTVTGANNTVSTGTGTAVSMTGTTIGGTGVVFRSVSASGGANGIVLNGTGAGTFGVTGDGVTAGSGGTIAPAAAGSGVSLTSTGGATLDYLTISGAGTGILGSGFGTLSVTGTSVTSTGAPVLNLTSGTVSGTFAGVSASGSSGHGVALDGVGGTWTVAAGTVTGSANGAALHLAGNQAGGALNWQAALAQTNEHPVLSVADHSNGTLNVTGTVSGTGTSTGLRFSNADASYNVSPSAATTLSGTGGAVSILLGSAGAFTFSGNLNAAYTSGSVAPFQVSNSNPNVTFNGNLTTGVAAAGRLVDVTNQSGGTITFQNGTLSATSGTGILLNNADGNVSFNGTTTLNGGDAGVDVENNSGGTFAFTAGASIANPTGVALAVSNSSPNLTFAGPITHNSGRAVSLSSVGGTVTLSGNISGSGAAASGILVQNSSANVTFSGASKSLSTQGNAAVTLGNNSGSILFSGGGLAITTTSGAAFNAASGGGTLQVTGANNTISSGTGTALSVQDVNIGASGLNFVSVSHAGGANGIVLVNTGATNGLQVTGTGAPGSGGTIVNTTGGDGATAGNGVYLSNARNVNLSWMNFSGHANHAIRGIGVVGFTLNKTRITGTNGTSAAHDEGSISFDNLTGSASIANSYIEGGFEENVRVANTSGTLDRLTMTSDTIGHNGTSGNNGVLLDGRATATLNATVQNSRFTGSRANNIRYAIAESATGDVIISGNTLTNNHPNKLGSDFGIYVSHVGSGATTYAVTNNSVNDAGGAAIEVDRGAGGTGAMTGSISSNTVGTAGVANSGSAQGSTIFVGLVGTGENATHTATISNNTLRQFTNYGIELLNSGTGTGYLNATVTGNNIAEPSPNSVSGGFPTSGIRAVLGVSSGPPAHDGRTCLDISGNVLNQTGTSISPEMRVWGRFATKTALPGLGQSGASSDPSTFLNNQNTITVAPGGLGAVTATSTNPFQSTCPPS